MKKNNFKKQTSNTANGIFSWFERKGVRDRDVMYETMANFLKTKGVEIHKDITVEFMVKEVSSSFQPFCSFAGTFLKNNNYTR